MNVLVIGSGGREHAICKACSKSNNLNKLYCFGPTLNPGINDLVYVYLVDTTKNSSKILKFALDNSITIVIVGPEAYLATDLVDQLWKHKISCIGPRQSLARIETSKIYARDKILNEIDLGCINPQYKAFRYNDNFDNKIMDYINQLMLNTNGYVIKADGLKSGKGVKVSGDHLKNIYDAIEYCSELKNEKSDFIVEEKLIGEEFSLMSFCDGKTIKHMPIVKDFKRAFNNDQGPNTGGMGSISYSDHSMPFLEDYDVESAQQINEEVMLMLSGDNETSEINKKYKGILYGSFIKTTSGIKVIEYNCRFGDPECINVFELLETDFLEICNAIVNTELENIEIKYKNKASVCKYLCPTGYPDNPCKDYDVYVTPSDSLTYASLKLVTTDNNNNHLYLGGSRTIAVTHTADRLEDAKDLVDNDINKIHGPLFYREDIGNEVWDTQYEDSVSSKYKQAGVDIDLANESLEDIKTHILSTYTDSVVSDYGDFGGIFKVGNELLVSSTDGVGTKSVLTYEQFGEDAMYNLGLDIVNHSINDILVKGADPLFFLDYFASNKLNKANLIQFVHGISNACKEANCVLIGGETAEMPSVYCNGKFDIVGTIIGKVDEAEIINGKQNIERQDIIIGLPSSGLHTNGYSLVRNILDDYEFEDTCIKDRVMNDLRQPHRSYLKEVNKIRRELNVNIHGLCHITGGGLFENPPRVLPNKMMFNFKEDALEMPYIFKFLMEAGNISKSEMYRVFNCGIGMMIVVSPEDKDVILNNIDEAREIGYVSRRNLLGQMVKFV